MAHGPIIKGHQPTAPVRVHEGAGSRKGRESSLEYETAQQECRSGMAVPLQADDVHEQCRNKKHAGWRGMLQDGEPMRRERRK
jgi:hypothetical protein